MIQCVAAVAILTLVGCQSSSSHTSAGSSCSNGQCTKTSTGGAICNGTTVRAR